MTRALREALDAAGRERHRFMVQPAWQQALSKVAEGHQQTLGAYDRPWK
ncbi:Uncharacterised protein [Chromobacterium violaceum]|uniref:Uncharacterized protein n=1 Tax=Chromobacterium violaceum TaxID=536 RepID=A0A3S4LP77_CHRVL|nr:Uncharacterised protein [Chromobacterium violaceum]